MRRNTVQGILVLETVRKLHSHPTADEVYEAVSQQNPVISRGTVYRNLNKLCDQGLIKKRYISGEPERFDHICTSHYHAKCLGCGKIYDIDMEYIPDLQKNIRNLSDFQFTEHNITFCGYCKECAPLRKDCP